MAQRQRGGFSGFMGTLLHGVNLVRLVILNIIFFGLLILFLLALGHTRPPLESDTVLVLHPQGELVEQYSVSPAARAMGTLSGQGVQQVRVRDMVAAINQAASDDDITRILLQPDDLKAGGFASLREVGAALERFRRAGKSVTVWARNMDQKQYYLAAHADKILLDPMGTLRVTGLSSYRLFYKDLLDKLGAKVHLFRVGQFKSAAEPYVLDHASDASKKADRYWLHGVWTQWLQDVADWRDLDADKLARATADWADKLDAAHGDAASMVKDMGLVDGAATRAQLVGDLRAQGVPAGPHDNGFRHVGMQEYLARVRPQPRPGSRSDVAVVVAAGEIQAGKQPPGTIGGASTAAQIRQARQDDDIKALVLRVDSPGGQVQPSERIRRQVARTREAGKPVVVSMGDVAASGGYWISMDADRIIAEPNTITGSIGIFGMLVDFPETLDKIGVHSDGVGVGPFDGGRNPMRPLDPDMASVVQSTIDKGYHDFVSRVADARDQSFDAIDAIAQGRVWTGRQARKRGLVDQLGGLHTAVAQAADLADLGTHYTAGYIQPKVSGFAAFLQGFSQNAMVHVLLDHGVRLPGWTRSLVERAAPDLRLLQQATAGKPQSYAYCFCQLSQ